MSRTAWSKPYLKAITVDGSHDVVTAADIPADATRLELRWRHPGRADARKRTVPSDDAVRVTALLDLAVALRTAHADPDRWVPDATGAPVRPIAISTARTVPRPLAPQPPGTTVSYLRPELDPARHLSPEAHTPAPAGGAVGPVSWPQVPGVSALLASPDNPTVARIAAGAMSPGSTVRELIAQYWDAHAVSALDGSKNRTDIESHLGFIEQYFRYDNGTEHDSDEVLAWKEARIAAVGARVGDSLHVALLLPYDFTTFMEYRRRYDARVARLNVQAVTRHTAAVRAWDEAGGTGPRPEPPGMYPAKQVGDRTVQATMTTCNALMLHAGRAGMLTSPDPWAVFKSSGPNGKSPVPRPAKTRVSQRSVPAVGDAVALGAALATAGPARGGAPLGARYAAAPELMVAGQLRPSELWELPPDALTCVDGRWWLLVERAGGPAAAAHTVDGRSVEHRDRTKHREPGDSRLNEIPAAVGRRIDVHRDRYSNDTYLFTSQLGCRVDWGNDVDSVWRPAVDAVFGPGSRFADLDLSELRKVGITWALRAGLTHEQVAERAGHTVAVQLDHYAGVVTPEQGARTFTGWDDAWAWAIQETQATLPAHRRR